MATIRMALSAGAALIALMAIGPAASQAQAPLQLVPGPDQAKKAARAGSTDSAKAAASRKKAAKPSGNATRTADKPPRRNAATATATSTKPASTKAASNKATSTKAAFAKKPARATAAAERSSDKSARKNSKTPSVASRRQNEPTANAPRARVASAPRVTPVVATARVSEPVFAQEPVRYRAGSEPQIVAQGGNEPVTTDNVMRGSDSVSLVALLPWWRSPIQDVSYGSEAADSKVIAAADAWFAAHGTEAVWDDPDRETVAATDETNTGTVEIADAGDLNEIDLAVASQPEPPEPTFMQSLIALLGGVVAAAAASARLLFV